MSHIRQLLDAIAPTINSIRTALFDDGRSNRKARRFAESLEPRLLLSAVTLQGGNGSDTFYIRRDPETDDILLWQNTALEENPTRYPGHDIDSFEINAGDGDDTLTLDNSDGDPLRSDALIFNGGTGEDTLVFTGPSTLASRTVYTPAQNQTNAGSMRTGFKLMTFTGVDAISTLNFNSGTLISPGATDSIAIDSPSATENTVSGQSDAVAFPPLTFSFISQFTLDTASNETSANDSITISSDGMTASDLDVLKIQNGQGIQIQIPYWLIFSFAGVISCYLALRRTKKAQGPGFHLATAATTSAPPPPSAPNAEKPPKPRQPNQPHTNLLNSEF
ncbi:MAG TPA: hypothetical protein VGQ99_01035 [Tepidisphaeraceae bacterium]|nr:hypothetical protein [Tepidisphaeraceae bacterium]